MKTILMTAALMFSVGCVGSAKIHFQDTQGGILVLEGDEGKALEDAQKKMAGHCGSAGHTIVKRETVVVGTEDYSKTSAGYDETEDRSKDTAAAGASSTSSESGYQEDAAVVGATSTRRGPRGSSTVSGAAASASGSEYSETDSEYVEATSEDESTRRQGVQESETVSGTRQVTEARVHYRCGQ